MSASIDRRYTDQAASVPGSASGAVEKAALFRLRFRNPHECDTAPVVTDALQVAQLASDVVFSDQRVSHAEFGEISRSSPGAAVNRIPHFDRLLTEKGSVAIMLRDQRVDVGVETWAFPEMEPEMLGIAADEERRASAAVVYVVKTSRSSGGKGVRVVHGMRGALAEARLDGAAVVQPYLLRPLLFEGRKADLRVYLLLVNPGLECSPFRAFLFRDGIGRVAATEYEDPTGREVTASSLSRHLTNDAVGTALQQRELSELMVPFAALNLSEAVWGNLCRLVADLVRAVSAEVRRREATDPVPVQGGGPVRCFQLLGLDISVHGEAVALLEINSKPCMGCDRKKLDWVRRVNCATMAATLELGSCAGQDALLDAAARRHAGVLQEIPVHN